jgi:hypothetical protein
MNSFISNFKKHYKTVCVDLLVFFALLFICDRVIFFLIQRGEAFFYKQVSPYSLRDKFAKAGKKSDFPILILGTSRAYDGIHPLYIKKKLGMNAFKEAFVGKGPVYNYYFYREFKKNMGIPRVVLYGLDYFLYNITTQRHWMQRFNTGIINALYRHRGVSLLLANKENIDNFLNTVLNNFQKNLGRNNSLFVEQDVSLMGNYLGMAGTGDIDTREPDHYDKFFFFPYPGEEGIYFSRLLEELHRDQVTVLLISLPEYVGTYLSNKSHRPFQRAFKLYQRRYGNVHFLDYNNIRKFDLKNPEYFIDGGYGKTNSHLSRAGAKIFNGMLIEDLRKYLPDNGIQKRK